MKRAFRWVMNPDNNGVTLAVVLGFCALCVIISFAMVKP